MTGASPRLPQPPEALPLPPGFRVALDSSTRQLAPGIWFGGSGRIIRMTPAGQAAWRDLQSGPVTSRADGLLARRLTDAGLAHPVPPDLTPDLDVTVVIPARDRADLLDQCLGALLPRYPVVVVDDGSIDPAAVAAVATRHGARLIRREANGGPAAARNTALEAVTNDLVAFLDSDCIPPPDWIGTLAGHFADPLVAAVAPRITGQASAAGTWCGRYASASSSLDLGAGAARVAPRAAVAYVPTAALVARRAALLAVARGGQVFDEELRHGEDVDLVWRLHAAGWRVRYDPAVQVVHRDPATWSALLARRYRYGTSAAPLALRHRGAVTHLVLHPWPAATVASLLARRPFAAAAAFGASVLTMDLTLRRESVPRDGLLSAMLSGTRQTWLGMGRYATQFAAPLLLTVLTVPGGRSRIMRAGRRLAAASLLLGPPLQAWGTSAKTLGPARFTLGRVADDIAYGLGVWRGCLSERTTGPLRPVIAWRRLKVGDQQ
jgi:mycofactocin system glycosyltransferase